jgi:hypothetical protein
MGGSFHDKGPVFDQALEVHEDEFALSWAAILKVGRGGENEV